MLCKTMKHIYADPVSISDDPDLQQTLSSPTQRARQL